jgi:uncharacterized protein
MRILLLIAIALLLYVIISNLVRKSRLEKLSNLQSQKMVKCSQCGVHLAESESLKKGNLFFCSQQHLDEFN